METGNIIRDLRLERNLMQKELASKIHIAPNTLSQFEKGKARPSYEVLLALANFFECSTDFLLGRSDDLGNITIHTEKPAPLPPDTQELVNIYQALSPAHRSQILEYARYFAEKSGAASTRRKA